MFELLQKIARLYACYLAGNAHVLFIYFRIVFELLNVFVLVSCALVKFIESFFTSF